MPDHITAEQQEMSQLANALFDNARILQGPAIPGSDLAKVLPVPPVPSPLAMSQALATAMGEATNGMHDWLTAVGDTFTHLGRITQAVGQRLAQVDHESADGMRAQLRRISAGIPKLPGQPPAKVNPLPDSADGLRVPLPQGMQHDH